MVTVDGAGEDETIFAVDVAVDVAVVFAVGVGAVGMGAGGVGADAAGELAR
jgi:hypothetical protein